MSRPLPCTTSICEACLGARRTWVGDRDAWHTDVTAARLWAGAGHGCRLLGVLIFAFGFFLPNRLIGWLVSAAGVVVLLLGWCLIFRAARRLRRLGVTR